RGDCNRHPARCRAGTRRERSRGARLGAAIDVPATTGLATRADRRRGRNPVLALLDHLHEQAERRLALSQSASGAAAESFGVLLEGADAVRAALAHERLTTAALKRRHDRVELARVSSYQI